jgi:hypothetical protein
VVVVEMLGVVKLVPVPTIFPAVAASYQVNVPAEAVADKTAVPVPHIEAGVEAVIVGTVFTVATTAVLLVDMVPLSSAST